MRKNTLSKGFKPAFKGYQNFPASICASINDEVVHGLPSKNRILKDGDIIGIDFGVYDGEYYSDSAFTFGVGTISNDVSKLLEVTKSSLEQGIKLAKPGNKILIFQKLFRSVLNLKDFQLFAHMLDMELEKSFMKSLMFQISFQVKRIAIHL